MGDQALVLVQEEIERQHGEWLAQQLELQPRLTIEGAAVKDWIALFSNPAWKSMEHYLVESLMLTMAGLRVKPIAELPVLQGQARALAGLLDIVAKAAQYCSSEKEEQTA